MAHANPLKAKTLPTISGSFFKLLTAGNPKVMKGTKKGYMTFILHLAPGMLSGKQVCPKATRGCLDACLNTAGRGGIAKGGNLTLATITEGKRTNAIQLKRIWRTQLYFNDRETFVAMLVADIRKAIAWSDANDLIPVFRLNGTSDIRFELATHEGRNVMRDIFPTIQFYDYTKIANRKNLPSNYHLTFSLADGNDVEAQRALANGMNVAAVFRNAATVRHYIREGYTLGGIKTPVHNGDESDLRFLDESGIIALYAKGNARRDTSGFVRD